MISWADLARGKAAVTKPQTQTSAAPPILAHEAHDHCAQPEEDGASACFGAVRDPLTVAATATNTSCEEHLLTSSSATSSSSVLSPSTLEPQQKERCGEGAKNNKDAGIIKRSTRRGEGMITSSVARLAADVWAAVLSFCPYSTVLRTGAACVSLRSLSLVKSLWTRLREAHSVQYELDMGHAVPELEFTYPVEMSRVVTTAAKHHHNQLSSASRAGGSSLYGQGQRQTDVDTQNEPAAEFIRFVRYLARSEARVWHLREFTNSYAPVIETGTIRMGFVTSYDEDLAPPASAVPIVITAAERRGPFLKPSDISTVFSHQAANAMAACRIETHDVTASYTQGFLQRLGRCLATPSLHRRLSRSFASASLIEISQPEALQCLRVYSGARARSADDSEMYASMLSMLLDDITIEDSETRYFAVRQLSSEAHIGVVMVDPIIAVFIAAGSGLAY